VGFETKKFMMPVVVKTSELEPEKPVCSAKIRDGGSAWCKPRPCVIPAKHHEDGHRWCGTHLPSGVKERKEKHRQVMEDRWKTKRRQEIERTVRRAAHFVSRVDSDLAFKIHEKIGEILKKEQP